MTGPLRFGTLGAAAIAPAALVRPAREVGGAELVAVAARDPARARAFAHKHRIERVHESYEALLADPDVDAIYNPLPNGLHGHWTIRALEAGKHVLCEKPFAANADEAAEMAAVAERTGLVVMEAFHWRYHPLAERMLEITRSGELGDVRRVEAALCFPLLDWRDIRYRLDLAGGAMMDAGCYAVHLVRTLADAEPEVTRAEWRRFGPDVDRWMRAELRFADGRTGSVEASMLSASALKAFARVTGDRGEMFVLNPVLPHVFHRLRVRTVSGRRSERVDGDATYTHQLRAFVRAVREGEAILTGPPDACANMRAIDAIYEAAGLPRRKPSAR